MVAADALRGRPHRRAGREAVVDQDRGATVEVGRRPVAPVRALPARQLRLLACRDGVDLRRGDARHLDDLRVEHPDAAGRDGAHRELLVPRHAELPDEEDVERDAELPRDLEADGHASARQREDDDVSAARVSAEPLAEEAPGVGAVPKPLHDRPSRSVACGRDESGSITRAGSRGRAYRAKNASVRTWMLSRAGASAGDVGSSKAECAVKRARPGSES